MFPFSVLNPTVRSPFVTVAIIAINFAVMLGMIRLPEVKQEAVVVQYGFVPARIQQLRDPNFVVRVRMEHPAFNPRAGRMMIERVQYELPPVRSAIYLSVFTGLFLHGGWMHLLGNMWFLWLFGHNVEDRLGHFIYAGFYLVGGAVATACHWLSDPASTVPVIGASGAIAAVLGAYAVTFPFARVRTLVFLVVFVTVIELPSLAVLGFWFITQLAEALGAVRLGIGGGNAAVAFWAHVGGFVFGMIFIPLTCGPPPREAAPPDDGDDRWQPAQRGQPF